MFFFKKKGPYKDDRTEYAQKAKQYITAVDTAYNLWHSEKSAAAAQDDLVKDVQSGREARARDARVKNKTKMDAARDVGLEALNKQESGV